MNELKLISSYILVAFYAILLLGSILILLYDCIKYGCKIHTRSMYFYMFAIAITISTYSVNKHKRIINI